MSHALYFFLNLSTGICVIQIKPEMHLQLGVHRVG